MTFDDRTAYNAGKNLYKQLGGGQPFHTLDLAARVYYIGKAMTVIALFLADIKEDGYTVEEPSK